MRGMYLEDFEVGAEYITPGRTITETDLVQFAALTGDWNQIHTDEEFAKSTIYGTRIVHGLFGLSLMEGMKFRLGHFEGTAIASLGWEVKFVKALLVGDTVRVRVKIHSKRNTKKEDRGILVEDVALLNQRDEVVTEATHTVMMRRRNGA